MHEKPEKKHSFEYLPRLNICSFYLNKRYQMYRCHGIEVPFMFLLPLEETLNLLNAIYSICSEGSRLNNICLQIKRYLKELTTVKTKKYNVYVDRRTVSFMKDQLVILLFI